MKNILTILLLTLAVSSFGQTYGWMIRIDPGQDADTANMGIMYPDGSGNLTGRMHFVSYATVLEKLAAFSPDTVYVNAGDSLVIVSIDGDTTYFAGGGGGGVADGDKGDITVSSGGTVWTIDNLAITNGKIANDAIDASKIAPDAVGSSEIATNAVGSSEIATGGVQSIDILDNTITGDDIATDALSDQHFAPSTLAGFGITDGALDANVVHKTGDESVMGEKTLNDSLTVDDYAKFMGTDGGYATKIEMLKSGRLKFSKYNNTGNDYYTWLQIDDIQTGHGNVPWYSSVGTTSFIGDDLNNFTLTQGFNLSGGGSAVESGKPAWGESWEYHYAPSVSQILSEWHRMFVDSAGVQYRPESIIIDHGDLNSWYKYYTLHRTFWIDPNNSGLWADLYRDGTNGSNLKLLGSGSGKGAQLYVSGTGDLAGFYNVGMTNPHFYIFDSGTSYVHMRYLDFEPSGNAATSIAGLGADGLATTALLGSGLSLSAGTLNTSASATSKWTDGGSYIYPTSNEAVHIPSYNASATGNLNVIGPIDQMFPTSSLSNIAIGRGVGNGTLTGADNVYLGNYAGIDNTSGSANILIGYAAGENFTGSNGVAIGYQAMQTNASGTGNMAIGDRALKTATGGSNMAIGNQSLQKTTTGTGNTAVGNIALHENLGGADNTAIGKSAGQNGASGSNNVYVGANAGLGASANAASGNVSVGTGSGGSMTGDNNTFVGSSAGGQTTGGSNVMIGASAGYNNLSGSDNVFIGTTAGYNETGSNKLYIDNSTTATPLIKGDFSADSVRINGSLSVSTMASGAATDSVVTWNPSTKKYHVRNPSSLGGAGVSDGDKGDITVSGSGATWNIDADAVGTNEIATDGVGSAEIVADAVGSSELAATSVAAGTYYGANFTVDADGRLTSVASDYIISPAQITSDQDNYNPTAFGKAKYIRISSDNGMRAITSMVDSTGGEHTKVITNIGSYMLYFPMDHPDGTAANRFTGQPSDIYLFPGQTREFYYDATSSRWRCVNYTMDEQRLHLYYNASARSTATGDNADLTFTAIGTGSAGNTAPTSPRPGYIQLSTASSSTAGYVLSFVKTANTYTTYADAHIFVECQLFFPTLSDGTETYTTEVQLSSSGTSTSLEPNNLIGVRYSSGINSGKWELFTQSNTGTEATADLGVTVAANTVYKIRIELDKANAEARAYVNGSYAGRVASNVTATACAGRIIHLKSAGSTARTANIVRLSSGAAYPY